MLLLRRPLWQLMGWGLCNANGAHVGDAEQGHANLWEDLLDDHGSVWGAQTRGGSVQHGAPPYFVTFWVIVAYLQDKDTRMKATDLLSLRIQLDDMKRNMLQYCITYKTIWSNLAHLSTEARVTHTHNVWWLRTAIHVHSFVSSPVRLQKRRDVGGAGILCPYCLGGKAWTASCASTLGQNSSKLWTSFPFLAPHDLRLWFSPEFLTCGPSLANDLLEAKSGILLLWRRVSSRAAPILTLPSCTQSISRCRLYE